MHTGKGATFHRTISAATTNDTAVVGHRAQLVSIMCSNINAAVRYLKIYNTAGTPTVGTDTPSMTLLLPASSNVNFNFSPGIEFPAGIGFGLTTALADNSTAAVAANEHVVHIAYT